MNFQQLRSVREAVRCGFNLTEVAALLYTSQPGVSRQIRELEEELGVEICARRQAGWTGRRPGQAVLPIVERLLQDADNLKRPGRTTAPATKGACSSLPRTAGAPSALPHVVRDFRAMFPQVSLHLHQGSPKQVVEMLLSGEADIGVATEALSHYDALVNAAVLLLDAQHRGAARPPAAGAARARHVAAVAGVPHHHLRGWLHRPPAHRRGLCSARGSSPMWCSRPWMPM